MVVTIALQAGLLASVALIAAIAIAQDWMNSR